VRANAHNAKFDVFEFSFRQNYPDKMETPYAGIDSHPRPSRCGAFGWNGLSQDNSFVPVPTKGVPPSLPL
jgi:hypothetical protein